MYRKKNGLSTTRLAGIYYKMVRRCNNPKDAGYSRYGGRGIRVCKEWEKDFMSFYNWALKNGYAENLTIDRINNDGNYEPSNCRWITNAEQQRNKSTNHYITYGGKKMIIREAAELSGMSEKTLAQRAAVSTDESYLYFKGIHPSSIMRGIARTDEFGNIKHYISIHQAASDSNVPPGNIVKVCRGERKRANGFRFAYIDKNELLKK